MRSDGRSIADGSQVEADLCIIGAGAAGITIARELDATGARILLLEAGGLEATGADQDLYHGESTGRFYPPLEASRLRFFGGTTNHWAGWCRPLDPEDFEPRGNPPREGWPITRADLDPFYARAHPICELGGYDYRVEKWVAATGIEPIALDGTDLASSVFQLSPPVRFAPAYGPEIERSENLHLILHANATRLETDPERRRVLRVAVTTDAGNRFAVLASRYVLATGGIENARLLLLSDGLGNEHDLVGRYFMDHPIVQSSVLVPTDPEVDAAFYDRTLRTGGGDFRIRGIFTVSPELRRREELSNFAMTFLPEYGDGERKQAVASASRIRDDLGRGEWPEDFGQHVANVFRDFEEIADLGYKKLTGANTSIFAERPSRYRVKTLLEPTPLPDSRVTLSEERDALGLRRVRLHWRLGDAELATARRSSEILAQAVGSAGLGRVKVATELAADGWPESLHPAMHHLGTTRMHTDPRRGVVDADCRVHGIQNLWIAGSSLFPSAGFANPTLTIVALSLRLADQLEDSLRAPAP